jgi:glutamyl/glutaminyl-tRNA synthetase
VFQIKRLEWINASFIRQMPLERLTELCMPYLKETGLVTNESVSNIEPMIKLYQERIRKLSEIPQLIDFFFKKPEYAVGQLVWKNNSEQEIKRALQELELLATAISDEQWNKETLEKIILQEIEKGTLLRQGSEGQGRGVWLWPMRVALTGKEASAGPFEIAAGLGKQETIERLQLAIKKL